MRADWLVATADWPPDLGGMSEYADGLVGGLRELGVRTRLRVARGSGRPAVRAARLAPLLWADHATSRAPRLLALQWSPVGLAAWALWRAFGWPYQVVTYGLDVLEPERSPTARSWMRRVLGDAERVWAISRFTRDRVLQLGVRPERVELLPPGVEWRRFERPDEERVARLRQRLGLEEGRVLLSVGRLVRRKGHDLVLRALPRLPEDVRYLVVGDGPERRALADLARELGVERRVVQAGALSEVDVATAYALADAFVLPTRELPDAGDVEGFGIVYLEAGAAGKPVVAAASGGAVDAVVDGETGLLVSPDDVDALVTGLSRVFGDRDLAERLGRAGRRRAQHDFDWKTLAARLAQAPPVPPC